MLTKIIVALLVLHTVSSQIPSTCPDVLMYEPRNSELDRWYATVTLSSTYQLKGIWLRITLDRPSELLGNIFGDATTDDNREFLIRSQNYVLQAGKTTTVRFFVKFNAASIIPSVVEISLNGQLICPSSNQQTTGRPTAARPTSNSNRRTTTTNLPGQRIRQTTERLIEINVPNSNVDSNSNNNRPSNTRPSRPNNNIKQTTSSNTFTTSSSNSYSNTDEDFYNYTSSSSGNSFNAETGYNNRSVHTGISLGTNSDIDVDFNENNYNNQGEFEYERPVDSENTDEFFPGDFPAIIKRPASNPIRPNINKNTQCGRVASHATPLISYGQNTRPGQWPWHVALYHSKDIQLMYICGGTLISLNHVLTAAHCVTRPQTNRRINQENLVVYLGKHNLKKFGSDIQDKEVVAIYVHPKYNYSGYNNDISILRLGGPAEITNYVRPVCLWEGTDSLNEVEGLYGTVVGWGFDHKQEPSTSLMQAQMPVVSTEKCFFSNKHFFSEFLSEKSYCAGFRNGTSVCNGDSGGGMVFPKKSSDSSTVWQIRGIVSVGVALQGQAVCDPTQYIIFTDVAKHLGWIHQILVKYP